MLGDGIAMTPEQGYVMYSSPDVGDNDANFSMAMWINPANNYQPDNKHFTTHGQVVFGMMDEGLDDSYPTLMIKGKKVRIRFGHRDNDGGYCDATSNANALTYNAWQHLVVTFDGNLFRLYVNKELVDIFSGTNCAGETPSNADNIFKQAYMGNAIYPAIYFDTMNVTGRNSSSTDIQEFFLWSGENIHDNGVESVKTIWVSAPNIGDDGVTNIGEWAYTNTFDDLTFAHCEYDIDTATYGDGCRNIWLQTDPNYDPSNDPNSDDKDRASNYEPTDGPAYTWKHLKTHTHLETPGVKTLSYIQDFRNLFDGVLTYNLYHTGFEGKLDEIRLYNSLLSGPAVETIYNTGIRALDLNFDVAPGKRTFVDDSLNNFSVGCSDTSCPDSGIPGRDNQAVRFDGGTTDDDGQDGVADFLAINATDTELDLGTNNFTVAAWVKPDIVSGRQVVVGAERVNDASVGAADGFAFGLANANLWFASYGIQDYIATSTSVPVGVWSHVAAVLEPDNDVAFYINGVLAETVSGSTPMRTNSNDTYRIGAATGAGSDTNSREFFDGLIDHVVLEKLALDASAIQSIMRESPVLNLHLDEDLNTTTFMDSTQFANNATCAANQCPEAGAKGQIREAPVFDGVDDRLTIADSSELDLANFTVGLWVKPTTRKGIIQPLITKEANDGSSRHFGLFIQPDSMTVHYSMNRSNCSTWVSGNSTSELFENTWNHLMLTFNGQQLILYINGSPQGTLNYTGTPCLNNHPVKIGDEVSAYTAFAGSMDEVTIQGKALDAASVSEVYNYQVSWYDITYHHTILVDVDNPEIQSLSVIDNGFRALSDSLITINAVDTSSEIAGVTVQLTPPNGPAQTFNAQAGDDEANATWFYLFTPTVAGQYTIQVTATDDVGRNGSLSRTFFVDDIKPTITLSNGSTNQVNAAAFANNVAQISAVQTTTVGVSNSNRLLQIDGTFADPGATASGIDVATASYEVFDWQGNSINGRIPATNGIAWYPFTVAGYGQYTVEAAIADNVGNWYTDTVGIIAIDDLAPVADVTLGVDIPLTRDTTLAGTVTDVPYPTGNKRFHFHFEEAAGSSQFVDSSRNMFVATCDAVSTACSLASAAGHDGRGIELDGNDNLTLAYEESLELTNATLMAWIQPTWTAGSLGADATILSMDNGTQTGYRWQIANGLNGMSLNNGTSTETLPMSLSSGQWSHVALVMEEGVWTGYLNGVPVGDPITQTFGSQVDLPLHIGSNGSSGLFTGLLDEVVIYERALDAEEIHRIAQPLSGSITSLKLRFRTFAERDLGVDEGTWYDVIASGTGTNFSAWSLPLPALALGHYKIDLKAVDGLGNSSYIGEAWNGFYRSEDLVVTKSASAASVAPSQPLAYAIAYTNTGPIAALSSVMTETVPVDSVFNAAASTTGWSCNPAAGTAGATCAFALGTVESNASGTVNFAVDMLPVISANVEVITNTVEIASANSDTNPLDNQAVVTTTVDAAPDLVLTKEDDGNVFSNNQDVTYTFTYSNVGNQVATDVRIIDYLPDELSSFDSDGFTCVFESGPERYSCYKEIGTLAPSQSGSVQFTRGLFSDFPPAIITNTAVITEVSGLPDLNPANNWASVGTPASVGIVTIDQPTVVVNEGDLAQNGGTVAEGWLSFSAYLGELEADASNLTWTWSYATSDGPDESQAVTLEIFTNSEQEGFFSFDIQVANVAPTVALTGAETIADGAVYALTLGPAVDPGNDTVTACQINWGDTSAGSAQANSEDCLAALGGGIMNHVYASGTTSATISVDLTDEDGTHVDAGTKNVVLSAGNAAPIATSDVYTTSVDNTLDVAVPGVLANDTDSNNNPLTAILDVTTTNGTLTLNGDGSFSYVPNNGYVGVDTFAYHANDGTADPSTANSSIVTVILNVTAIPNGAPTITSSNSASAAENQTAAIDVNATDDIDSEGAGLSYALTGTADDVLFNIDSSSGVVSFISAPDFESPADAGADNDYNIQVTVTDSGGLTAVQDIVITVTDAVDGDVTPPTASPTFAPTPNAAGWNNTNVTITWNWVDNPEGSGIDSDNCVLVTVITSEGNSSALAECSDLAGNVGSASSSVNIDKASPETTITSSPPDTSTTGDATFDFGGTDAISGVSHFECQLDGGGFGPCTGPQSYTGLDNGSHIFEVRAIDVADNVDQIPASYGWTIDVTGPNTPPSVEAGPAQTIMLPFIVNLSGTVTDDGQPGPLTVEWSMISRTWRCHLWR